MEAVALKAIFDALESFGPGAVILAGLGYMVWRGEQSRTRKAGEAEQQFIAAMNALTKSNERLAGNFDENIRAVEAIQTNMDEIKAVLHRLSEMGAEMKGRLK